MAASRLAEILVARLVGARSGLDEAAQVGTSDTGTTDTGTTDTGTTDTGTTGTETSVTTPKREFVAPILSADLPVVLPRGVNGSALSARFAQDVLPRIPSNEQLKSLPVNCEDLVVGTCPLGDVAVAAMQNQDGGAATPTTAARRLVGLLRATRTIRLLMPGRSTRTTKSSSWRTRSIAGIQAP
jgi:hypothetical protein